MSRIVVPAEIPRICVCTAPATPTVHKSEFDIFIVGVIAEGGGDFKVVVLSVVIVLFVVESVTITSSSANTAVDISNSKSTAIIFIVLPKVKVTLLK
jgi:hypothetical protein